MSFSGKVIVVTGAAGGMGKVTATMLAERGAKVALMDLKVPQTLVDEIESHGGEVLALPCDVTSAEDVEAAIRMTAEKLGPIDGAANLAGVIGAGNTPGKTENSLLETDDKEWDRIVNINLGGVKNCMRAELRHYNPKGCSIVNASSMSALRGTAYNAPYSAAKAGVIALTQSVGQEMGSLGVRINAIAPGVVDTPLFEHIANVNAKKALMNTNSFGRLGRPEEIAKFVLFLLSDDSSFCNATVYQIDGGRIQRVHARGEADWFDEAGERALPRKAPQIKVEQSLEFGLPAPVTARRKPNLRSVNMHTQSQDPTIVAIAAAPQRHLELDAHGSRDAGVLQQKRRKSGLRRENDECQQKKVKCSGEDTCDHCRMRQRSCVYSVTRQDASQREPKRRRKTQEVDVRSTAEAPVEHPRGEISAQQVVITLQERVRRLEEEIGSATEHRRLSQQNIQLEPNEPFPHANQDNGQTQFHTAAISNVDHPANIVQPSPSGSDGAISDSSDHSSIHQTGEGETDTFDGPILQSQGLSLFSQLIGLRSILGLESKSMEVSRKSPYSRSNHSLDLPGPVRLRQLLEVYFRDVDSFLPYLDQSDTEQRVFAALENLGHNEQHQKIFFESEYCSLLALLCNMLAMAECYYSPEDTIEEARPGWPKYLEGMRLIQHCSSPEAIDMDVVRYYAVGAAYLMHSECLQAATQSLSMAFQLATKVGLNNQMTWNDCSPVEILVRKKLWWTIYFMDRRISQKNGAPYLIRDAEVQVEEFTGDSITKVTPWSYNQRILSKSLRVLSHKESENGDYVQVLISLGRLWGQIWDAFFAVRASNIGDLQEIEIMDARILYLQRHLPQNLRWVDGMVSSYISGGETEPHVRRRLGTLTRITTMRLIIRQNPLIKTRDDLETKRFCAELARATIEAIAIYTKSFSTLRPSGYFITASLIECICHLVPFLQTHSPQSEVAAAADSFRTAYKILLSLSKTMNGARRAVRTLRNVFTVDESVSFFKTLVTDLEQGDNTVIGDTIRQRNQCRGTVTEVLPTNVGIPRLYPGMNNNSLSRPSANSAKLYEHGDSTGQSQLPETLRSRQQPGATFESLFDLGLSPDVHFFNESTSGFDLGSQNFIYSDIMGEFPT